MIQAALLLTTFVCGADSSALQAARSVDVQIQADSTLRGEVVSSTGAPAAQALVQLQSLRGEVLASASADEQGRFALPNVRPGVYRVVTASGSVEVRVWSAATAPPTASGSLLLTTGPTVRGQLGGHGGNGKIGLGVGVVGATVATVIATTSADRDGS